ncbi:TetR/AcrR family transcriptional regulator [Phenylobacterium sp.]|uniref:TetR/AcrR family transcriptional regulator n=1 Tax=Phenylobacterium sp. TaxID=1871053 RepID=UPI00271CCF60|nr:TetR/AcrR family transcriptional regulator [Phenylobacterium sp.]MDO8381120.1 TetR family transcriptional regulator [Phenylobacterium sp.]
MLEAVAAPPTRKGPQTAGRIREAALELFSRLGFERVTMGEIAAAAGVSQATLHYHFDDKACLWRAAMLQLGAVIAEEERLLEAMADAPPEVQLRMAMKLFLRISWKHPALGRIVALEGMAGGERLAWLDAHLTGPRNRRLAEIAQAAIDSGALKPFPAPMLVITLQAASAGVINLAPMMGVSFGMDPSAPEARQAHEQMILDAILGGLLTHPTTP